MKTLIKLFVIAVAGAGLLFLTVAFSGQHFCLGNTNICFTSE